MHPPKMGHGRCQERVAGAESDGKVAEGCQNSVEKTMGKFKLRQLRGECAYIKVHRHLKMPTMHPSRLIYRFGYVRTKLNMTVPVWVE